MLRNTLEFYTEEELIDRVWDREKIQAVMAKRAFLSANENRREEINTLWVREPEHQNTASLGKNWGYYIGIDNIIKYYVVAHHEKGMKPLKKIAEANPSISDNFENYHYGCTSFHPLSTPLIEIAGDGNTAKGLWYSVGQETTRLPDGTGDAVWTCYKIGADLVNGFQGRYCIPIIFIAYAFIAMMITPFRKHRAGGFRAVWVISRVPVIIGIVLLAAGVCIYLKQFSMFIPVF